MKAAPPLPSPAEVLRFVDLQVPADLASQVGTFYYLRLPAPEVPGSPRRLVLMPSICVDLVLNLGAPYRVESGGQEQRVERGAFLRGSFPGLRFLHREGELHLMGARFKHGAISSLLPFPLKELQRRKLPLRSLWPEQAAALEELAAGPASPARLLRGFEAVLRELLKRAQRPDPLVRRAVKLFAQAQGDLEVSALAGELGVSRQTVKHKFDQHVGISPKAFGKLCRFQALLRRVASGRKADWPDLARKSGYYDQAHLIREFNHFTGFSPQKFLKNMEKSEDFFVFHNADQSHYHRSPQA